LSVKIECVDCGREVDAPNGQTKYCTLHRLARAVEWHDGRTVECRNCGRDYVAWHGRGRDRRCGQCVATAMPGGTRDSVKGGCRLCRQQKNLVSEDVTLCYPCLHDPINREKVPRMVLAKSAQVKREQGRSG